MNAPVIIRLYRGEQLIEVKQFDSNQIVIGHNAEVQIDLDDASVAPIHAIIEKRDSGHYICDLGSGSGTKLNGETILDEKIQTGDRIDIGPFSLEFHVGVPKPKMRPPTAPPPKTTPGGVPPGPQVDLPDAPPAPDAGASEPPIAKPPEPTPPPTPEPQKTPAPEPTVPRPQPVSQLRPTPRPTPQVRQGLAPGEVRQVTDVIKPSKGSVLEVIVCWGQRILSTHHFDKPGMITVGSGEKADIYIEAMKRKQQPVVKIGKICSVIASPDLMGQYITPSQVQDLAAVVRAGRARQVGKFQFIDVQQGEMARLHFQQDNIDLYFRYVEKAPPVVAAPLFDFSMSEWTGIILSAALSLLMALYVGLYSPTELEKEEEKEIQRIAKFIYKAPPKPKPVATPAPTPAPTPPPRRVKVEEKKQPQRIKVGEAKKKTEKKTTSKTPAKKKPARKAKTARKGKAGKAQAVRAKPGPKKNKFGTIKKGGAKKIGKKKAGANARSKKKDVTKMGLLSAFGGGGVRQQLDQTYSGAGELIGMGNQATGTSGQINDRPGAGIGGGLREVGSGGKGTSTKGITGVSTQGRGSGNYGYGAGGGGLGDKGRVLVTPGGQEERFTGTIDREAVRRVVRAGLRQLQNCYERELNRTPGLSGKIVVQWEIGEQGRVLKTKQQTSSLGSRRVSQCIQKRIANWIFPEPPEGVIAVVDFPFVFVSNQ